MNPLRQAGKWLFSALLPQRLGFCHGPRRGRGIALTFDDGPHPEHTPRLLDLLAIHDIPATFFVIGERAERCPEIIRRIVAEGHTLGHHSYTHSEPAQTTARRLADEVDRTRLLLQEITGQNCDLFRPPKGKLTAAKTAALWRREQTIVLWNVDPRDYRCTDAAEMSRWAAGYSPRSGDIVLLHDLHPYCLATIAPLAARRTAGAIPRFETFADWLQSSSPTDAQVAASVTR